MDEQLGEDDELSSVELQHLVSRKFAVEISTSTIRRYLVSLQWTVVKTRFGPMISDKNKGKRLEFARMCLDTNDDFANVIWTDESSVQLRRHSQIMRVKVGAERVLKPQAKQGVNFLHVFFYSHEYTRTICVSNAICWIPIFNQYSTCAHTV